MLKETTYQTGESIRLEATFNDLGNMPIDQDLVRFKVYDYKYNLINDFALDTVANKLSNGHYMFDYIAPTTPQRIYYEWYGEKNGSPSIARGGFRTVFMK
jgi:hypothetical protein